MLKKAFDARGIQAFAYVSESNPTKLKKSDIFVDWLPNNTHR